MGKRSNFTPMNRFHEIIDHYGLKLMEVGVNHLRLLSAPDETLRLPAMATVDLPVSP